MAIGDDIFKILRVRKYYFVLTRRITSYFSKKISVEAFFRSWFLTATAEETTKKDQFSYESFPRLVKLFIENYYPG